MCSNSIMKLLDTLLRIDVQVYFLNQLLNFNMIARVYVGEGGQAPRAVLAKFEKCGHTIYTQCIDCVFKYDNKVIRYFATYRYLGVTTQPTC